MPIHAIAGHLALVTAPLAALLALVYAARPEGRGAVRVPLLVAVLLNTGVTIWSATSGSPLYGRLRELAGGAAAGFQAQALPHAKRGDLLTLVSLVLAVLVVVLVFRRLAPGRPASGAGHAVAAGTLGIAALLVAWLTASTQWLATQSVWSHHQLWGG